MNQPQPRGTINPAEQQWINVPIVCVFGYPSWPHIISCKTMKVGHQQQVNLYGYTERNPGHGKFNSIDQPLNEWVKQQKMCLFFGKKEDALSYLGELITPRGVR